MKQPGSTSTSWHAISMLGNELRAEMATRNSDLLRTLFFGTVATNATLVGLVFAAVRLG